MVDNTKLENELPEVSEPNGVGWHLRRAREEKGLSLEQVAAETRISKRHIEHIEAGEFDALPARAYAVGFSRTLAKTVGLDQADVVAMVHAEMQDDRPRDRHAGTGGGTFEPGDPARSPGGRLVWFSLFAVVLLLAGIFFAARVFFAPAAELPSLTQAEQDGQEAAQAQQAGTSGNTAAPANATGPVVFTATGEVWVRFYDSQDRILSEQTLAEGESYTVPADAVGPKIITGRPDLLTITVGGEAVPPLSEELVTVSDVDVSAAGLLARNAPAPTATGAGPPAATSE
ncbi:MAG: helix-turn-helix domain-containing protein [Erythrobacter sp.]|nr:MAG: helix-turn-helix domain-containing protein [Erythrobacter sp.]